MQRITLLFVAVVVSLFVCFSFCLNQNDLSSSGFFRGLWKFRVDTWKSREAYAPAFSASSISSAWMFPWKRGAHLQSSKKWKETRLVWRRYVSECASIITTFFVKTIKQLWKTVHIRTPLITRCLSKTVIDIYIHVYVVKERIWFMSAPLYCILIYLFIYFYYYNFSGKHFHLSPRIRRSLRTFSLSKSVGQTAGVFCRTPSGRRTPNDFDV